MMFSGSTPVRILGIGGSVRQASISRMVLETMLVKASDSGAETVLADVRSLNFPVYNEELPLDQQPGALSWLLEQMQQADGFILCSPTYHGSMAGAIKNVLDALHVRHGQHRTYFDQRPVGLAAYGGPSAINTINALTNTVRSMRGLMVPTTVTVSREALNPTHDRVIDDGVLKRMNAMVDEVVKLAAARRLADSGVAHI